MAGPSASYGAVRSSRQAARRRRRARRGGAAADAAPAVRTRTAAVTRAATPPGFAQWRQRLIRTVALPAARRVRRRRWRRSHRSSAATRLCVSLPPPQPAQPGDKQAQRRWRRARPGAAEGADRALRRRRARATNHAATFCAAARAARPRAGACRRRGAALRAAAAGSARWTHMRSATLTPTRNRGCACRAPSARAPAAPPAVAVHAVPQLLASCLLCCGGFFRCGVRHGSFWTPSRCWRNAAAAADADQRSFIQQHVPLPALVRRALTGLLFAPGGVPETHICHCAILCWSAHHVRSHTPAPSGARTAARGRARRARRRARDGAPRRHAGAHRFGAAAGVLPCCCSRRAVVLQRCVRLHHGQRDAARLRHGRPAAGRRDRVRPTARRAPCALRAQPLRA